MTLGFVGTGTISAAIIRGLANAGWAEPVVVSPRNADMAAALASEFGHVRIAEDNQGVVDASDTVFIAVRPQNVDEVVPALRFRAEQAVVSLVATLSIPQLRAMVGEGPVLSRANPPPFVEQKVGVTGIFPKGSASVPLFEQLGRAVVVDQEEQMHLLMTASATMGGFFLLQDSVAKWLVDQGLPADLARSYLGQFISGLAVGAEQRPHESFEALITEFSTRGGLNEQWHKHLSAEGLPEAARSGLDAILKRVQGR